MNNMKMKKQLMRLLGCAAFVLVLLCIGTKTIRLHTYKYDSLLFQNVEALSSSDKNPKTKGTMTCPGDAQYGYIAIRTININEYAHDRDEKDSNGNNIGIDKRYIVVYDACVALGTGDYPGNDIHYERTSKTEAGEELCIFNCKRDFEKELTDQLTKIRSN